jgi:hypothetical protein
MLEKNIGHDFQKGNVYTIDNITYNDLIQYQNAKIKITSGIFWDGDYIDNHEVLKYLVACKSQTDKINEIGHIKNKIIFIHG